ncbi:conjugal transfer protein TraX [Leptotrichia sp. OH3620_COT-345]|uniref:TraX family protein n=1 Tax=Leptotrichia sp. OH3620_COT-345 TaxID=2491048 RepID=UPI000F64EEB2|nr:TraX family protein [Leptotrichia sp. OH3620_COT-345]RRD40274.1 conjugal transfer protein TraX [Leptotrichia sp. OH3620_COT-345]
MDLFTLKIIGIITMFIDHWHFIIGGPEILNIIGRTAFPIFAFSLNEGYIHTRNLKKYLFRLLIFGIVIQSPVIIFKMPYSVNIFFTLFTGLLIIYLYHLEKVNILMKVVIISFLCYITLKFEFDYGIYGILTIVIFHFFREDKIKLLLSFMLLNLINLKFPFIFELMKIQIYSIFVLVPICLYNGKRGKNMKYFFYFFYPLHFLLLQGIKIFIEK